MFDRKKYKKFALMQLKGRWTTAVLVTLICSILILLLHPEDIKNVFDEISNINIARIEETGSSFDSDSFFKSKSFENNISAKGFIEDLSLYLSLFAEFIIIFAEINVFITMSHGPEPYSLKNFFNGFSSWSKAILCGLWKSLWLFLWALLFIIPAFVKYYSYSQMEYLLLEYPELSITKAMNISKEITRNHKGDLFILDLSFLGWAILALIPARLGFLWLKPYMNMAKINAYHGLLKEAVNRGIIKPEDLKN